MYIFFLSSGCKRCLIVVGRDKMAERAFWISQSDSSYLLASSYLIHFWMWRNGIERVEGRREILAGQEKDKMYKTDGWFQGREKGPEKIMDLGRFQEWQWFLLLFDFITWSWVQVKILFHGLVVQDWEEDLCLLRSFLAVYPCATCHLHFAWGWKFEFLVASPWMLANSSLKRLARLPLWVFLAIEASLKNY